MARVKNKNTSTEWAVRRLVHGLGYRYRLHGKVLPGRPDLVFSRRRKVIFVHGCFWHRHPDPDCALARLPKSRQEFWLPKFDANVARDARVQGELANKGWGVLVIWECDLRDRASLRDRIRGFLDDEID